MAEKVADYEKLLTTLMSKVSDEDARAIQASLDKVCPSISVNTVSLC